MEYCENQAFAFAVYKKFLLFQKYILSSIINHKYIIWPILYLKLLAIFVSFVTRDMPVCHICDIFLKSGLAILVSFSVFVRDIYYFVSLLYQLLLHLDKSILHHNNKCIIRA